MRLSLAPLVGRRSRSPRSPDQLGRLTAGSGRRGGRSLASVALEAPSADAVLLVVIIGVLDLIGLVMVLSASSVVSLRQYGSAWVYFEHQLLWVALGTVAMTLTSRFDYHRWRRLSPFLLGVSLVLLVAVLAPGVGTHVGGSSRWVGAGQLRLQPSELMKLALVVFGASLLSRRHDEIDNRRRTVLPVVLVVAFTSALVMAQPDMGTTLVLACIAFGLLFAASVPMRTMWKLLGASAGLAALFAMAEPYRRARLLSFVNPWAHRSGSGYQVVQSLVGLGSGGVFGLGLGASRAKWGFLPNSYTDFIFSIIGEELGLIGCLLVIGLFLALVLVCLRVARRACDQLGMLLVIGITCWVAAQAVMNMGAATGILPVAGVPLPFVSFGGSSLVIVMAALGIVLNVASRGRRSPRS
jgi:cell division protein FtsW